MTLHAASREALDLAERALGEVLAGAGTDPAKVGEELLSVVDLLDREIGLRRAVGDSSVAPESRQGLVRRLFDGKLSEQALKVLDTVAGSRWSSHRELVDGLESVGRSALLTAAEKAGNIETVESQLFQVARIVAGAPELEAALSDLAAPADAKRTLVRGLFADKVDAVVETLVEQAVQRAKGRGIGHALDKLVALAAERRERSVAYVTSANALTDEQRALLGTKLDGIYGRPIALHVEIDPNLGGGLVVRVGDEVIDGSTSGQLAAVRRTLSRA
ncbi:ATP synthase F1 subcomplex delta subunit [Amycolatopsis echigonensis]|uniref:ATP synthase subunit delta n=1 Tax=Amycolatopsis echigonensis TaxID=2576905 RepID=A0A2N3WLR9_9PSEU|nr:F0F1 ATP synthase subunit delta [Amycolatopsis niigatensis]PKV94821.1 ATP synthase F1 subcomplex delta subunit [Amycolatopsis niigatensis]